MNRAPSLSTVRNWALKEFLELRASAEAIRNVRTEEDWYRLGHVALEVANIWRLCLRSY